MSSKITILHILFKGLLNLDEDDDDEVDIGEIDAKAFELKNEINRLQPYRYPEVELDYLGLNGEFELIFQFRITWMDREADIEDYLDEVQVVIENGLEALINERQWLGTRTI